MNGPGEAKEADLGIASGKGKGSFLKRKSCQKAREKDFAPVLLREVQEMTKELL